jgi:hypothetical protein
MLLGFYAWVTTVAVPAFSGDAPSRAGWFATSALLSLILAWAAAAKWRVAADLLLVVFIACGFVTWVTLGHARLATNLAQLRTAMGAIGWGMFAVAWVQARQVRRHKFGSFEQVKASGLAGNVQLLFSLVLVFAVVARLGIQSGNGRGVLVTTLAVAWSIGMLDTSALLATRNELHSKGLGIRLLTAPRILLAVGLAGVGYFLGLTR